MEKAAREGNASEFASHFTEESRPFAEALLSLYATQGTAEGGNTPSPLALLAHSSVESEQIEGEKAYLTVRAPTEQGGQIHVLVFKKTDGAWKLDIALTEEKNANHE